MNDVIQTQTSEYYFLVSMVSLSNPTLRIFHPSNESNSKDAVFRDLREVKF